jgi:cytochrome P450
MSRSSLIDVRTAVDARRVPRLSGAPVLGSMRELRRDYLGTISRAAREIGGLARIAAGPPGWRVIVYSVTSPELAAEILSQPDRFRKNGPGYRELRQALGENMLTSEDESWHRQRRFLAPIFTRRRIAGDYVHIMIEEAERLVERWQAAAAEGRSVDLYPEMVGVTSRVIGRILFGADVSRALPELTRFSLVNDELLRRAVSPHPMPRWLPTSHNRQLSHELEQVRRIVDEIIAERQSEHLKRPTADMLDLLLAARDAENASDRLTDTEVANQVLLFLIAGRETTSVTLACTLLQLALAPQWQTTLREEVTERLHGRVPLAEDVPKLEWTDRFLRESMRLYPAAHGMNRSTLNDEILAGYHIPAGSWLEVSIWGIHHSRAVWHEPEIFDPRRFDVPAGQFPGGHKYAWMPFGAGPRACIGMQIAMLEIPIVVAAVLQAFVLDTPLSAVPLHAAITVLPSAALPLQLRPLKRDRGAT